MIIFWQVTTSVLWTQSYILGKTVPDGVSLNTQSYTWWYYTPKESTSRPDDVNNKSVDLGRAALLETANICYGGALMIFAVILFMRVITNTTLPHPRNKLGERGIAYFETSMLAYAFLSTICGMAATALGMEVNNDKRIRLHMNHICDA